ncbi:hypothetical protein [Haloarchaeobius litoreus]|uniref:Uncharacterized protein n=1 Tax=Haloarchaeobius litoreus TaxID=755306 RepID=A0ABD6DEC4_9EURY|nr:hypothetical protein [Haloarchaeobius litoreus]
MTEEYYLHSRPVKPKPLIDAVIGLSNSPQRLGSSEVAEIIDMSEPYAKAALRLAKELNMVVEQDGQFEVVKGLEEEARKMSPDQGFVLINRYAQRYNPFMTFLSFIHKEYEPDRAAQTVKTVYDMDTSVDVIRKQFSYLGKAADLLDDSDGLSLTIEVDSVPTSYVEDLQTALQSEAKARLYIVEKLGDRVVAYADDESIEKFQEALLTYRESPDNAIVNAVVGAENITRELAVDEGDKTTDYSNANGIGSLANMMRGDGLILKRQLHGANYLGAMRIPGAHGKESETLETWQVEPEVSLEVILSALSYTRSLYFCIKEDRQVL